MTLPLVSVVILNFNGRVWLQRCLTSLANQSILADLEVIVADNASTDASDQLARELLNSIPVRHEVLQNGANLGYCEGNNRGAAKAKGKYLLFLNTDTWLENDCLEKLLRATETAKAESASPMVLNYDDDSFQTNGASGFDLFGYLTGPKGPVPGGKIFGAPGCCLLVKKDIFDRLGGFDAEFFMYADEIDLAWRLTLSGALTITVPEARVHHRGAAAANPKGGQQVVEFRTNEKVRFFATRNSLVVILKNAQHLFLTLLLTQCLWVGLEIIAVLLMTRSFGTIKRAYFCAFADLWRLRYHIRGERRRIGKLRRHGDFYLLRFLCLRPGRWVEVQKLLHFGPPKVSSTKS